MALKPGDRIGAIADEDEQEVKLLGYGIYEGDFSCTMQNDEPMPRLKMDSGMTVWGFLCTWGSEERVKREIGNRKVVVATMQDALIASLRHIFEEDGEGMEALMASRVAMSLAQITGSVTDLIGKLVRDDRKSIRLTMMAQSILLASMVMALGDGSHPEWQPVVPERPLEKDRQAIYHKILVDLEGWINRSMRAMVPADDFDPIHLVPHDDDE